MRIFDDRIEFWNPAILPQGWTAETLKRKHESKPFNPLLAESFFWIKYAEEIGIGTNKIIRWCQEWSLPEPEFEYAGSSLVVTLRKTMVTGEFLKQFDLGNRERKVIDHISVNKRIDSREVQEMFEVTRETANQLLKRLRGLKLIERHGVGKATFYTLKGH